MNIPDAMTLDKLCKAQQAIGECPDQNCDGCILNRMILASKECRDLVENMMFDMLNNASSPISVLVSAVSCGILLGRDFQKLKEKEVPNKVKQ